MVERAARRAALFLFSFPPSRPAAPPNAAPHKPARAYIAAVHVRVAGGAPPPRRRARRRR